MCLPVQAVFLTTDIAHHWPKAILICRAKIIMYIVTTVLKSVHIVDDLKLGCDDFII